MKLQLLFSVAFSLFFLSALNAQEIEYKGSFYEVKASSILLEGYDVTKSLTTYDQRAIHNAYEAKADEFRAIRRSERAKNKAQAKLERQFEKEVNKAEREAEGEKRFVIF